MPPVTSASPGLWPVLDLYPPVSHDSRWWWVVLGCLVAAAAVLWGCRRVLTRIDVAATAEGPATLETIRATALRDLDAAADACRRGEPDRTVCRDISMALRRFAALACDSDLDYEGLDELSRHAEEDPRLDPVVEVVERCYAVEFDPKGHGVDTDELLADAVRTVRSWT